MPEWIKAKCPSCAELDGRPMSETGGELHYRCPACLWSWVSVPVPVPATCHAPLGVGQKCDECGSYNPRVR